MSGTERPRPAPTLPFLCGRACDKNMAGTRQSTSGRAPIAESPGENVDTENTDSGRRAFGQLTYVLATNPIRTGLADRSAD